MNGNYVNTAGGAIWTWLRSKMEIRSSKTSRYDILCTLQLWHDGILESDREYGINNECFEINGLLDGLQISVWDSWETLCCLEWNCWNKTFSGLQIMQSRSFLGHCGTVSLICAWDCSSIIVFPILLSSWSVLCACCIYGGGAWLAICSNL